MKNEKNVKIGILGLGVVGSELVSLIQKNKIRIEMRDKKGFDLLIDISRSQKILNFSPNYIFPEGIDEEIKLMQSRLKKNLS